MKSSARPLLLALLSQVIGAHADWPADFGPTTSPLVVITNGTARFAGKTDAQRAYLRTTAMNLAARSFVAEVTVQVPPGGSLGMAFFGLGHGEADAAFYHEPALRPSLCLALAPSGFGDGLARVTADGAVHELARPGPGDGTHRVRLLWDAASRLARFEVAPHWRGGAFVPAFGEVVRRDPEQLVLRVKNPTTYPASLSVLAESRAAARRPLGRNRLVHAPVWGIAPGDQKLFTVSLSPEGQAESPLR